MPQGRTTTQPTTAPTADPVTSAPTARATKLTAEHLRVLPGQGRSEPRPLAVVGYR
jgi:hypothetical protein